MKLEDNELANDSCIKTWSTSVKKTPRTTTYKKGGQPDCPRAVTPSGQGTPGDKLEHMYVDT